MRTHANITSTRTCLTNVETHDKYQLILNLMLTNHPKRIRMDAVPFEMKRLDISGSSQSQNYRHQSSLIKDFSCSCVLSQDAPNVTGLDCMKDKRGDLEYPPKHQLVS